MRNGGCGDIQYHLQRARSERDVAYRSDNARVADVHMRLSALHLHRALLLQAVTRGPVGNVYPLRSTAPAIFASSAQAAAQA
jgi:hypothetical protein